jgi:hypothetical protein
VGDSYYIPMTNTETSKTTLVVMTKAAHMPNSCWGRYTRVGLVEVDPSKLPAGETTPRMLSDRARGVVRVVRTWEKCFDGSSDRCAASRALKAAQKLKAELMAEHPELYV